MSNGQQGRKRPADIAGCSVTNSKGSNTNLIAAKRNKKDEFYTQLSDIENELRHYGEHFRNKTVYCNCDDPMASNFFRFFQLKFRKLGLKKLITTCYQNNNPNLFSFHDSEKSIGIVITERKGCSHELPKMEIFNLKGDGDFRSDEGMELLKQADIVVTNPPFSLFRKYVAQLIEHEKKFIVIGHQNAITYKEIFPLIQGNKLWLGFGFKGGQHTFLAIIKTMQQPLIEKRV